jgi:hypothetical protein
MPRTRVKRRDIFEWVGVAVDLAQAFLLAIGVIGALYWFTKDGGLSAVVVGIGIIVVFLLVGIVILLARRPN